MSYHIYLFMTKILNIWLEDEEHAQAFKVKGDLTWKQFLLQAAGIEARPSLTKTKVKSNDVDNKRGLGLSGTRKRDRNDNPFPRGVKETAGPLDHPSANDLKQELMDRK